MRSSFIKTAAACLTILAASDSWAATVPPALITKRSFTITKVVIATPTGDPMTAGSVDNQFTFAGAGGVATAAGEVTIPVQATVTPAADAATIGSSIKWTIDAVPAGSALTWSPAWPGDPTAGQGVNAVATLSGYPTSNSDFGPRVIKMEVIQGGKVLTTKTTPIALFFKATDTAPGRTAPNWFYYWNGSAAGELNAIYAATILNLSNNPVFGDTPAGKFWSTYAGPRRRIRISDRARTSDTRLDGSNQTVTGIDLFANTVAHENRHVKQVFDNNTQPFYSGRTGALREAVTAGWSFQDVYATPNVGIYIAGSTTTLWNHFVDNDSNGYFSTGDTDLDTDTDDIANSLEIPACNGNRDVECQAEQEETIPEGTYKSIDWAYPGKQHY